MAITFSLKYASILLGENWRWSLFKYIEKGTNDVIAKWRNTKDRQHSQHSTITYKPRIYFAVYCWRRHALDYF